MLTEPHRLVLLVQTFREMLDQEWSKNIAQSGGMGLGEMLYRQLTDVDGIVPANRQEDDHAY